MTPPKPKQRQKLSSDLAVYLRKVGRKAQKGKEPNDRACDRDFGRKLKSMSPLEIDALMKADDEDEQSTA